MTGSWLYSTFFSRFIENATSSDCKNSDYCSFPQIFFLDFPENLTIFFAIFPENLTISYNCLSQSAIKRS